MKTDLISSIIAAIVGTIAAYFVCNLLIPKIDNFSYPALNSEFNYDLEEPNNEVFNYRAVNPTVEVYVGNCTGDDCETAIIIEDDTTQEEENEEPEETPEEQSGEDEELIDGTTD